MFILITDAHIVGVHGHVQAVVVLGDRPSTPIKTYDSTAAGIVNSSIRQKKSKAMDMRFYWIKDRVSQKHFLVY